MFQRVHLDRIQEDSQSNQVEIEFFGDLYSPAVPQITSCTGEGEHGELMDLVDENHVYIYSC